jgi:hypothetical protein
MMMTASRCQRVFSRPLPALVGLLRVAGLVLCGLICTTALPSRALAQDLPSRQVTLFGILATPGSTTIDPQLKNMAPQLRKLLPGYGFKLLQVESKRLAVTQTVACEKLNQWSVETTLLDALDDNGKVQLRLALGYQGQLQMATIVSTPPNQLFFFDKALDDGSHLLIGIGAR